jgi:ubiquinone/menaquinone biosynthesis C-methylase UbiE
MGETYVHGYHRRENARLEDQAGTLVELLHSDTVYPDGSLVLEVGCGVGAQTVTLARRSPNARFVSVDVSADSVAEARRSATEAGLTNVGFQAADIFALPFTTASFDHVFVCFLLEHLSGPAEALASLDRLLKPGAPSRSSKATTDRRTSIQIAPRPTLRSGARSRCSWRLVATHLSADSFTR